MDIQDWSLYTASPWNGGLLPDGVCIALRTTCYRDGFGGLHDLNSWVTTMPGNSAFELRSNNYLTALEPGGDTGCIFRVTVCPQPNGPLPQGPSSYQSIALQEAGGGYLTTDNIRDGAFGPGQLALSATQDDAFIFILDLTFGQQTVLYPLSVTYKQRDSVTSDSWDGVEIAAVHRMFTPDNSDSAPIVYQWLSGGWGPESHLDVFVMTLKNGIRIQDSTDGAMYLVLDGTLHLVPENTNELLFAPPKDGATWFTVNGIATMGSYPIGPPMDMWAVVAAVDGRFYLIENNTKRLLNLFALARFGFKADYVRTDFTEEALAEFPDGPVIS